MAGLFSDKPRDPRRRADEIPAPPPPTAAAFWVDDSEPAPTSSRATRRSSGSRFEAEMDMSEVDDRDRPGPLWIGRGRELGRGHLVFRSRRMCYEGRRIIAAVHLIDDRPVPLFGRVTHCEYDMDGLYRVEMELLPLPERAELTMWIEARGQ
jgi:hypothetical protein